MSKIEQVILDLQDLLYEYDDGTWQQSNILKVLELLAEIGGYY